MSVYLDHNATTPVRPEAAEAVARGLALGGNPSSVHAAGRKARAVVEDARAAVAALVGASPASVTFTSGGTEANALAIESAVAAGLDRLLVLATDHDSVLESARATGAPLHLWPVDGGGVADLDWLAARLDEGGRPLVAVAWANHETGVVQPIAEIAERVRAAGGWLHVDAVQAASKRPLSWTEVAADTLSLSAHKLGGPQGVGALVAGPRAVLSRRLHGGGQERGVRAGTENVPGIAGFGAAALHAAPLSAQAPWRRGRATGPRSRRGRTGGGRRAAGARPVLRRRGLPVGASSHAAGPRRGAGLGRLRLLVGQGEGQPRRRRHGPRGFRALRPARLRRLVHDRGRLGPRRRDDAKDRLASRLRAFA
jgi:cysteine desulfurase